VWDTFEEGRIAVQFSQQATFEEVLWHMVNGVGKEEMGWSKKNHYEM
jgi:hypothetical protein